MENKYSNEIEKSRKNVRKNISILAVISSLLFFGFLILSAFSDIPSFVFPLFMFFLVISSLAVVLTSLKCPKCKTSLLKNFNSTSRCSKCGLRFDQEKKIEKSHVEQDFESQHGEIDWSPLNTASANFDTHKLTRSRNGEMYFKVRLGAYIFSGIFLLAGLVSGYFLIPDVLKSKTFFSQDSLILLIPLVFTLIGSFFVLSSMKKKTFSSFTNTYSNGKTRSLISDILLLQLLSRRVSSDSGSYTSYQLNFILNDRSRINIMCYANRESALKDSEMLSHYLKVKLVKASSLDLSESSTAKAS